MKKLVVCFLCFVALILGYLVFRVIKDNNDLKLEISSLSDLIYKNEIDKENYELKYKELDEIKEKNKDKAKKYDEVEVWNQEVIKYLD